jgi:hypothetical protein
MVSRRDLGTGAHCPRSRCSECVGSRIDARFIDQGTPDPLRASLTLHNVSTGVEETPVLNQVLAVGGQAEVVEVQAQGEILQTASSTLGTVIAARDISSLPLTSRNYTQILGL